jgi:hypothetical protein
MLDELHNEVFALCVAHIIGNLVNQLVGLKQQLLCLGDAQVIQY